MTSPEDIISVLDKMCSAVPESGTRVRANFDVIAAIYDSGLCSIARNPLLKAELDNSRLRGSDCDLEEREESRPEATLKEMREDPRVLCGDLFVFLFDKLTSLLSSSSSLSAPSTSTAAHLPLDPSHLLSVNHLRVLRSSLQFATVPAVLPYLEKGVGIPVAKRSQFIKLWRPLVHDRAFQRSQLLRASSCFFSLLSSNDQLHDMLLARHLADIVSMNEQLLQLEVESNKDCYVNFLRSLPPSIAIREFLLLSRQKGGKEWFQKSIGKRMSEKIQERSGVAGLIMAFGEMSSGTGNTPILLDSHFHEVISKQLARVPADIRRSEYHINIFRQFCDMIWKSAAEESDITRGRNAIFARFIDAISARKEAGGFILDELLKPFELLREARNPPDSARFTKALQVLAALCKPARQCPTFIASSQRFQRLNLVWIELLAAAKHESAELLADLATVITAAVLNISDEDFVSTSLRYLLIEPPKSVLCGFLTWKKQEGSKSKISPLIQILDEESAEVEKSQADGENLKYARLVPLFVHSEGDVEPLRVKVESLLEFFKCHAPERYHRLLLHFLCEAMKWWKSVGGGESSSERPAAEETDSLRLGFHLACEVAFDHFEEWQENGAEDEFGEEATLPLVQIATVALSSVVMSLREELGRQSLDIRTDLPKPGSFTEAAKKCVVRIASVATNVGWSIAPLAALLGDEALNKVLVQFRSAATEFCEVYSQLKKIPQEWENLAEVDRKMREVCEMVKIDEEGQKEPQGSGSDNSQRVNREEKNPTMEDILAAIQDSVPFERGHYILVVARALRRRDAVWVEAVDRHGLWEALIGCLYSPDSYVFLMAVDALVECVMCDTKRVHEMLRLFVDMSGGPGREEGGLREPLNHPESALVAARGKLAEALAKIFPALGTAAPSYLSSTVFSLLRVAMEDPEELSRASAFGALSSLAASCKGVGINNHITELVSAVKRTLDLEKSPLVRRSAIRLLVESIRGAGRDVIARLGSSASLTLRTFQHAALYDKDDTVRLHAELAFIDIEEAIREIIQEEESAIVRQVKIR